MKRENTLKWLAPVLIGSVVAAALVWLVSTAGASPNFQGGQTPLLISYQGYLTQNGQPITATLHITFTLYDAQTGGNVLWQEANKTVEVQDGLFTTYLGDQTALSRSVFAHGELWLGVQVEGRSEMSPRQRLVSAPYAIGAGDADTLDGMDSSAFGDITAVGAGTGLEGGGAGDAVTLSLASSYRLPQTCNNGQIAEWNGSQWQCGDDDVGQGGGGGDITAVYAGYGLGGGGESGGVTLYVLSTTIQSRITDTCAAGSAIREVGQDGTVVCETDDDTTYSAGTAITITAGNVIGVEDGGIDTAQLADNAVNSDKIKDGAVGTADLADGAVTSAKVQDGAIGNADLADGAVDSAKIQDGTVGTADLADNAVNSDKIKDGAVSTADLADGAVTSAKIQDGTIAFTDIGQNGCSNGQVMKWNGTAWNCSNDADSGGDITAVNAGTGLSGGGDTGDVTLNLDTGYTDNRYWKLGGNAIGGLLGSHFLGTTDGVTLTLKVSGTTALRLAPTTGTPNVIGGYEGNRVDSGVEGATIGGGGSSAPNNFNRVTADFGTVGGGKRNTAGDSATVSGGWWNTASGQYSTVGGGYHNTAGGQYATIGGGQSNTASASNATVGGGQNNSAQAWYDTIGGGLNNSTGPSAHASTVSGGYSNTAGGQYATVGGGYNNNASGNNATVGGGQNNDASGNGAVVAGGDNNTASGLVSFVGGGYGSEAGGENAAVVGGYQNTAAGYISFIGGGANISVTGQYAAVVGGSAITVTGDYAVVGGGEENQANHNYSFVGGGQTNTASGEWATVGGGQDNTASASYATVGGGRGNEASKGYATVGGGAFNTASDWYATVGGGRGNEASEGYATVGGGAFNTASDWYATVGGGNNNTASGGWATVPGGANNTASGQYSFAAGRGANAQHDGAFVWADSTTATFSSQRDNQFLVRANGGVQFEVNSGNWVEIYTTGGMVISTSTGAYLSTGGTWTDASDRNAKENFEPVEPQAVLEGVAQLPISTWNYKAEDDSIRHMGPVAQDFYAAFGLGADDKHIAPLDANGVALAAIQGLYQRSQEQAARIEALERENAALREEADALRAENESLRARLDDVEARLSALENKPAGGSGSILLPGAGLLLLGALWVTRRR